MIGNDALPRVDRGREIVALLVMDECDAHEVGALLVRCGDLVRAALQRGDEIVPPVLGLEDADPGIEARQIVRIAVDPALP